MRSLSRQTLAVFEDASASIPLRQIDRAFQAVDIRLGEDPGGLDGARRAQFRRYIAGVDQRDPRERDRLGDALGALIDEVAASKQAFLVQAAERDGFSFANGVFRPAKTARNAFAVTHVEDLAFLDDRGRRLRLLANENPAGAIAGATELVESVCRIVSSFLGAPAPAKTAEFADIVTSTVQKLEIAPAGDDARTRAALIRTSLQQLSAVVARIGELKNVSPRHARLAVGAAVAFAGFVADTYAEQAPNNA